MRRIIQISVLFLLYLLITAKSCDNQEQADDVRDQSGIKLTQDSIKSAFESDTLSRTSLEAFEVTAKIKLSDFNDYLTIVNDTSIAGTFREKAREMIRMLFISENSVLSFTNNGNLGMKEVSIKQLLDTEQKGPAIFGKIMIDSIKVIQALQLTGDSIYFGMLSYSYIPVGQKPEKNHRPVTASGTIDFLVTKHKKIFGKDTLNMWDVFLGNLE